MDRATEYEKEFRLHARELMLWCLLNELMNAMHITLHIPVHRNMLVHYRCVIVSIPEICMYLFIYIVLINIVNF